MAATILLGDVRAFIAGGVWYCRREDIARRLQDVSDPELVPTSDPDPDRYLAEHAAQVYGGQVVGSDMEPRPDPGPGGVY